jgi:hypothetical protein
MSMQRVKGMLHCCTAKRGPQAAELEKPPVIAGVCRGASLLPGIADTRFDGQFHPKRRVAHHDDLRIATLLDRVAATTFPAQVRSQRQTCRQTSPQLVSATAITSAVVPHAIPRPCRNHKIANQNLKSLIDILPSFR